MAVAVIVSLLIGLGAVGLGLWDLHKVNAINGQIAISVDNSVPATTIILPTNDQTVSGVVSLDALAVGSHVKTVQFIATGGSSHDVLIALGTPLLSGFGAKWNSAKLPNGTYQITSIGYNSAGHSKRSPSVTVHVQNL